jgi:hypothetical protein
VILARLEQAVRLDTHSHSPACKALLAKLLVHVLSLADNMYREIENLLASPLEILIVVKQ